MDENLTYCIICGIKIPKQLLSGHLQVAHERLSIEKSSSKYLASFTYWVLATKLVLLANPISEEC